MLLCIMPQETQVRVVDVTISAENDRELLKKLIIKYCDKYVYQLEKGEQTGFEHYQCRFHLKEKQRPAAFAAKLHDSLTGYVHVSPTSKENTGNNFYIVKDATRLEGPWSSEDKPVLKTVSKMTQLHPWQQSLIDATKDYDDRCIHVVIDYVGNHGKSSLCKYMWYHHQAQPVPPMQKAEDLVQFVMSMPQSRTYLIDMPRAMKKRHLYEFYSGIETIKNGMLYDKRYKGCFRYIDEPNIIVFTNSPPKLKYLSKDRWKLWTIQSNQLAEFLFV